MSGAGGERGRERDGGMEERKGGLNIPIKDGARVGGRGIGLNWERYRRSPKVRIRMGKKRGGRKGGRGERRWVWKMARASANAKTDSAARKRRSVTVTGNDGLNPIR
jgi:hypothetical protein